MKSCKLAIPLFFSLLVAASCAIGSSDTSAKFANPFGHGDLSYAAPPPVSVTRNYSRVWHVPADFATVQSAIDDPTVLTGDTIVVAPGTYAGAVITKGIEIKAGGHVVINGGPSLNAFLRTGFLLPDATASGARIAGFHFEGTPQSARVDDAWLDMAIYGRGARDVVVENNVMHNCLQAITSWNGSGWRIDGNRIVDLWTLNGGGIGILVGGFDGNGPYAGNVVAGNTIFGELAVCDCDHGGYDGTAVVLYADFRSTPGATAITGNIIADNDISLLSDRPYLVNANGIELTDTRQISQPPVVTDNLVDDNDIDRVSGVGIAVSGAPANRFTENEITGSGALDIFDDTTGSGTAGTAGFWDDNECNTSEPTGLCDDDDDSDSDSDDDSDSDSDSESDDDSDSESDFVGDEDSDGDSDSDSDDDSSS